MTNGLLLYYLRISSYIRKPFLIYDFATAPIWISLYMRKIFFFFIRAWIWHKTVFSGNSAQFYHGNGVRRAVFSVHIRNFFHGYDVRLCFQNIWANFNMGMMSVGCVFCPYGGMFSMDMIWDCVFSTFGTILPWEWCQGAVFSVPMGSFFHGYDIGLCFWQFETILPWEWCQGTVFFVPMGSFFSWIWYRTVFLAIWVNFTTKLCQGAVFLSIWGIFSMDMM